MIVSLMTYVFCLIVSQLLLFVSTCRYLPDSAIVKVLQVLVEGILDVSLGIQPYGRVELLVYYLRAGGHLEVVRSALEM